MTIKTNKEVILLFLISLFMLIFLAYIIFNILDLFNPVIMEEETTIITPQIHKLLLELEQKFK